MKDIEMDLFDVEIECMKVFFIELVYVIGLVDDSVELQ